MSNLRFSRGPTKMHKPSAFIAQTVHYGVNETVDSVVTLSLSQQLPRLQQTEAQTTCWLRVGNDSEE